MKITDSRARDILRWLDDQAGDRTHLFEQMTMYRDAAALIRQLQAAEQSAWHAGLDAGREQGRRNRLAEAATHKRELDSAGAFHFSDNGNDIEARIAQQPAAVGVDANELAGVRTRLKSGDYDGADVMKAWLAIDKLLAQQPAAVDEAMPALVELVTTLAATGTVTGGRIYFPERQTRELLKKARDALAAQPGGES